MDASSPAHALQLVEADVDGFRIFQASSGYAAFSQQAPPEDPWRLEPQAVRALQHAGKAGVFPDLASCHRWIAQAPLLSALHQASEALSRGDQQRAASQLTTLHSRQPGHPEVLLALAVLVIQLGQTGVLEELLPLLEDDDGTPAAPALVRSLTRLFHYPPTPRREDRPKALIMGNFSYEQFMAIQERLEGYDTFLLPVQGAEQRLPAYAALPAHLVITSLRFTLRAHGFALTVLPYAPWSSARQSLAATAATLSDHTQLIFLDNSLLEQLRDPGGKEAPEVEVDRSAWRRMQPSRERLLRYDGSQEDCALLELLLDYMEDQALQAMEDVKGQPGIALAGSGSLSRYLLTLLPRARALIRCVIEETPHASGLLEGVPVCGTMTVPLEVKVVLVTAQRWLEVARWQRRLPGHQLVTLDVLAQLAPDRIPSAAWMPVRRSIYPLEIPEIVFQKDQDLILVDLPARSMAQPPAGLAHVHNALKKTGIRFQTLDVDLILYHRFHARRAMDGVDRFYTPGGQAIPDDPWLPVHYLLWEQPDFLSFFKADIEEVVTALTRARPKMVAFSVQQASVSFVKAVARGLKASLPDTLLIMGGMSCQREGAAWLVAPDADYVVIGEADLTVGPLVEALARGERPRDLPGVLSRLDTPERVFVPGPLPEALDDLESPRYEWFDVKLYRNWDGQHLMPIIGSRGCHWARCRFCAECFRWRPRDPVKVADDLEWFYQRGFHRFVFNESDLHGIPANTELLCDEIIKRGMKIQLTAQLRCHPKVDRRYFDKLRAAGFGYLRFGVDGWSRHALQLQRKGYNLDMIRRNLRDATEAGITTATNCVVGVPGETEADIDEAIAFITELKDYIGIMEFINPLMLFRGSEYWNNPDAYHIVFHEDRESLRSRFPVAIPDHLWHSEEPYIDAAIRYQRYLRVAQTLRANGVRTGDFADFTTGKVKEKERFVKGLTQASSPAEEKSASPDANTTQGSAPRSGVSGGQAEESVSRPTPAPRLHRGFVLTEGSTGWEARPAGSSSQDPQGVLRATQATQLERVIDLLMGKEEGGRPLMLVSRDGQWLGARLFEADRRPPGSYIELIRQYREYNLLQVGDRILAVPLALGPMDLSLVENRRRAGIVEGLTPRDVIEQVDAMSLRQGRARR